jgi:phosphatidylinositol alpha-1,6-mannosyltransferase
VEAALAGKPVVGSRVGGSAEAVLHGKTGLVVDPESCHEISEALLTMLRNPETAVLMGREGRAWANAKFSEEALCENLGPLLCAYGFVRNSKLESQSLPHVQCAD